jgi:hypothetical protein
MLSSADAPVAARPPIVRVRANVLGELDAVRAVVTRVRPRVVYLVRFRVGRGAPAGSACAASASVRARAGSTPVLRVAVVPRSAWCAGASVVSVVAARRGGATGVALLRVLPAEALGSGDVIGRLRLGPTCPVERANDPCDPVARPAPVTVLALDSSGSEAARTVTLGDGSFALDLPAGSYTLHAEPGGTGLPRFSDTSVTVTATTTRSAPRRVVIAGDTGIR